MNPSRSPLVIECIGDDAFDPRVRPLVELAVRAVWSRFRGAEAQMTIILCESIGESQDLGRFLREGNVMALAIDTIRRRYGREFAQYVVLTAAHEAVHGIQHARGDARDAGSYAESPAEAEANREALALAIALFPEERARQFNGARVDERDIARYRALLTPSERETYARARALDSAA